MPYACVAFEESVESSMRESATRIAMGSAFVPQVTPFHVPLLGGLHVYEPETVQQAFAGAPLTRGRFCGWAIQSGQLRCAVELEDAAGVLDHLQGRLPRGRPWRTHYVTLGSVEDIEASRHDEFLAAISEAFPIDPTALWAAQRFEYHNAQPPTDFKAKKTNKAAAPSVPGAPLAPPKAKKQPRGRRRSAASPHLKWERRVEHVPSGLRPEKDATEASGSAIDDLIRTGTTGARAARATKRSGAARAVKVMGARMEMAP